MRRWRLACVAAAATIGLAGMAGHAAAVTVTEAPDWVLADAYYDGPVPQPVPGFDWPAWPVVRFDVTNDSAALGVYALMIGASPGSYADQWASSSNASMLFGGPWIPARYSDEQPVYLPQKENNGRLPADRNTYPSDDGTLDWSTTLLPIERDAAGQRYVDVYDGGVGSARFTLPSSFDAYKSVYWFETTGPFMTCANAGGGGCYRDSVPLLRGDTFSFYVTGGLASPVIYLDGSNYAGEAGLGVLLGSYAGVTTAVPVPEPGAWMLLLAGLGLVAVAGRRGGKPGNR